MVKEVSFAGLILVLLRIIIPPFAYAQGAGGLSNLTDYVNTTTLADLAQHTISFTLPSNAASILSTDYIQVYLPAFTNVTVANGVQGTYSGTPSYSVSGNYSRITGIGVVPGARITIDGISANNPGSSNGFQILVFVSSDEEGTIIKNIGNTVASRGGNQVSVTASVDTPQASLQITGYTAPQTFITFTKEGTVMGTDIATPLLGYFAKQFTGLTPGSQNITLYGVDSSNLITAPVPLSLYLPPYQQTTVSNLLLSPTLQLDSLEVVQGNDLVATGSAKPNSTITIFTDTPLRTYQATASATGLWSYTINNTSEYVIGDYRIFTIAQDESAIQSLTSISLNFSILSDSNGGGNSCGDITEGDLNCDGSINLTDFSILMYYWGENTANADINSDGYVNLTDFSIMMYYWGT